MQFIAKINQGEKKMKQPIDQVKETLKEVFQIEANVEHIEPYKMGKYWCDTLQESAVKLETKPEYTYPLLELRKMDTESEFDLFSKMMKNQQDRKADNVGEKEIMNYIKIFHDNLPGATHRYEPRHWDGGISYVTSSSLSYLRYIFGTNVSREGEILIDDSGMIRTDCFFNNGFFGNKHNEYNIKPNNFKAMMIVNALRFWIQGYFFHPAKPQEKWILVGDSCHTVSYAKSKQYTDMLHGTYYDQNAGKLPRYLINTIKAMNPTSFSDMSGYVRFQLNTDDEEFIIYQVDEQDPLQKDRPLYGFITIPATFISRDLTEQAKKEIFFNRLKAFKLIADFLMGILTPPLPEEFKLLQQGNEELQNLINDYLAPKYGGINHE